MVNNPFAEGVSVRVGGDASGATRALGNVQSSLLTTRKAALGLGGVLAGALAAKGIGTAIDAASDFETAMVEVQKVTDAQTADELAGSMRDLAQEIPIAAEELAGLAADAARFGIRGTENVEDFTETVAKMATATDLSSEQAGEAFARLATLTETPVDEMENLGSSINELSNNFATSAGEIVDSMLRSSAALNQFGLNNTEIVGMSAALNEVSESSQRAGSRLRRLAQELMDPRKVSDLAAALGMTEEEFRNIRKERPADLMMQIVEAFAEGGDTAEALRGTLQTTSRQAVAGLAQNIDGLRDALSQANTSFEEGTSLQEEFDAATQTFDSRVQVLKNNLNDLAITVGNDLLPALNPFLETVNDLLSGSEDLAEVLGPDTAADVEGLGEGFEEMGPPIRDIIDELIELTPKLVHLAEELLPSAELTLEGVADSLRVVAGALGVVNDSLDRLGEAWNKLPEPLREVLLGEGGAERGNFFRMIRENDPRLGQSRVRAEQAQQRFGAGERQRFQRAQEVRIVLEERTDVIDSRIDSRAESVVVRRERRAGRLRDRGTGVGG